MDLKQRVKEAEGFRSQPYMDCCGKYWRGCTCEHKGHLTIGWGINLDIGITEAEGEWLLDYRLADQIRRLTDALPWTARLGPVYREVLIEMVYNMGLGGLLTFTQMLAHAERGEWIEAAQELIDSDYGKKGATRKRAARLARQLVTGEYQ